MVYNDLDELRNKINDDKERIQCIVSEGVFNNEVNFGNTQIPELWDYADGIDTVDFLLKI